MENDALLSSEERSQLLALAREAIQEAVLNGKCHFPDLAQLSPKLRENGVCFVTLTTSEGDLRGCIGGLEATQPLAIDVCRHAASAALDDYRFYPVRAEELPFLHIEISCLTTPKLVEYKRPEELPDLLHPHQDGVILRSGQLRATFLPQVWLKLPDPCDFLSQLCLKMGEPGDLWRKRRLQVEVYRVEKFEEA